MKDLRTCTKCGNIYEHKEHYEAELCFECQSLLYALKKELTFSYTKKYVNCKFYKEKIIIIIEEIMV